MRRRRKTKILATLGPASNTRDKMRALFDAGVDVFRINMSHTDHDMLRRMVADLRALSDEVGRPIGILCDLQGPKIRLGRLTGGPRMLAEGERIRLVLGESSDKPGDVPIPHPEIFQAIKQKHALLIDDGKVRLRLLRKADTFADAVVLGAAVFGASAFLSSGLGAVFVALGVVVIVHPHVANASARNPTASFVLLFILSTLLMS